MEIANVRLRLNKLGSDVPLKDVTPAEAMFLHILHGPYNGGLTFGEEFSKIEIVGEALVAGTKTVVDKPEVPAKAAVGTLGTPGYTLAVVAVPAVTHEEEANVPRSNRQELLRLAKKYNGARNKENKPIIDEIWPDKMNPQLPKTFKEINWKEVSEVAAGVTTESVNYVTGNVVTTQLPS